MFRYLEEDRAEGRVVTNNDLTRKALQVALGLGVLKLVLDDCLGGSNNILLE